MQTRRLRAVLFDVDFTLSRPGPELGPEAYRRVGDTHGLEPRPGALRGRTDRGVRRPADAPRARARRGDLDRVHRGHRPRHGRRRGDGARACAVEIVRRWEIHANFDLYDDAIPALEALRAHGLRIGLISNGQRDLEAFARASRARRRRRGRLEESRPHEAARVDLRDRARGARGRATETVMVGDSYADDIEGARALGMRAILLDRDGLYPDEPDRITDLGALPAALGLGVRVAPAATSARQAAVWAPSTASSGWDARSTEFGRGLGSRRDRADADLLAVEQLEPVRERARREHRLELPREIVLCVAVLLLGELGPADQLAGPREELRLEGARASGGVHRPSGRPGSTQAPRSAAATRLLAEPVADQLVAPMRHRDAQPARASTCAGTTDERGEHLRHRTEAAGGEVRDQHRRPGRRVLEHAGPTEVVEVVPGALGVASLRPEAGDRAVDDGGREIVRADAEPRATPGRSPSSTTSARAQSRARTSDPSSGRRRPTPCRREGPRSQAGAARPQRIAARRLDPDDAGAEPHELAPGERDRQVPGELHDQDARSSGCVSACTTPILIES